MMRNHYALVWVFFADVEGRVQFVQSPLQD